MSTQCPRCGETASGKFCADCGAAMAAQNCLSCGKPMSAGARFCHHCGATASGAAATPAATRGGMPKGMPQAWTIAAGVIILLVAFVAGQQVMTGPATPDAGQAAGAPLAGSGRAVSATDIANMSPEEAASRLFDRVMRYVSDGKADSAAIFAPMAMLAYERIGPLDAHARYDIGTIASVVGDAAATVAQADTILKTQPNHLLGLILAAKGADLKKDVAGAAKYRTRLVAAAPAERAKGLKEYVDHQSDVDKALGKPGAAKK